MLSFNQKIDILTSYPELERKDVSLGRVNFHYEASLHEKKTVAYHLHPNGNGYVYAGLLPGYEPLTDGKGFVNIRDYGEAELRELVEASIRSLSEPPPEQEWKPATKRRKPPKEQRWSNAEGQKLDLRFEDDMWYVYAGLSLEMAFETHEEAEAYLAEEGFTRE